MAKNKLQGIAKKKVAKISGKKYFQKISEKIRLQYWQKNKLPRIAKK